MNPTPPAAAIRPPTTELAQPAELEGTSGQAEGVGPLHSQWQWHSTEGGPGDGSRWTRDQGRSDVNAQTAAKKLPGPNVGIDRSQQLTALALEALSPK